MLGSSFRLQNIPTPLPMINRPPELRFDFIVRRWISQDYEKRVLRPSCKTCAELFQPIELFFVQNDADFRLRRGRFQWRSRGHGAMLVVLITCREICGIALACGGILLWINLFRPHWIHRLSIFIKDLFNTDGAMWKSVMQLICNMWYSYKFWLKICLHPLDECISLSIKMLQLLKFCIYLI